MAGRSLASLGATREVIPAYYSVKEAIFPFLKFQNVDPILGPEMRSTGEVMGVGRSFGAAFARGHEAAGIRPPTVGKVFLSVRDGDKERLLPVAREVIARGFNLVATSGTASYLAEHGVVCERVNKVLEGAAYRRPDQERRNRLYRQHHRGQAGDRRLVLDPARGLQHRVTYSTTVAGARALVHSLDFRSDGEVHSLQELHKELSA
jgi:Carbamoylphosphate synthase large subunit (split gene in MJ)